MNQTRHRSENYATDIFGMAVCSARRSSAGVRFALAALRWRCGDADVGCEESALGISRLIAPHRSQRAESVSLVFGD
jgi:hypothetical protein